MANEYDYYNVTSYDLYNETNGLGGGNGYAKVGWYDAPINRSNKGGYRVASVALSQGQTLNFANLSMIPTSRTGSNQIKFIIRGIKETNTSDFNGSSPFGRTLTTASATGTYDISGTNTVTGINVKSIVEEVIGQGGWSSGNHIGFTIDDNGTTTGSDQVVFFSEGILTVRVSAEPNFFPTPTTVSAPTFPATDDYGIKISMPNVDVKSATEEQLWFTTKKDLLKVKAEGTIACTANVLATVAHGLSYKPKALVFARNNGKSFPLPRIFSSTDPSGADGVFGSFSVDSTNLNIYVGSSVTCYYYLFLDEQA